MLISIPLVVLCLVVGLLIGAIGIGGVLLVPALTFVSGIGVHEAVPVCTLSFLATGVIGVMVYARHGSIPWRSVGWLCLGAVPGAYLGSVSLLGIPAVAVMLSIAALMIVSGIDALIKAYRRPLQAGTGRQLGPVQFGVIGFVTGFGSAITGTGGPLILVPMLIFLGLPVLTSIGLAQAIQLPIGTFASIGNYQADNLDFERVAVIAPILVVGTFCGALLVHHLPADPIRKGIAFLLVIVGSAIALRQLLAL